MNFPAHHMKGRDSRPPLIFAFFEAEVFRKIGFAARHHGKTPSAPRCEFLLGRGRIRRNHDKGRAVRQMRKHAVESVRPHGAIRARRAHIVDDDQILFPAEQGGKLHGAVQRDKGVIFDGLARQLAFELGDFLMLPDYIFLPAGEFFGEFFRFHGNRELGLNQDQGKVS